MVGRYRWGSRCGSTPSAGGGQRNRGEWRGRGGYGAVAAPCAGCGGGRGPPSPGPGGVLSHSPAAGRGGRGRGRAGPGRLLALGAALLVSSLLASLPAPGGGWEAGGRGLSERGPPGVERGRQGAAAAPRKRVRRGGCGPGLPEFPGPSGGRTEGVNAPSEVDPRAAAARRSVSNLPRGAAAASGRPAGPWGEPGVL